MIRMLVAIAVIGCAVALWLMQSETDAPKPATLTASPVPERTEETPVSRRIARDRVRDSKAKGMESSATTDVPAEDPVVRTDASAPAPETPKGPFTVDLGAHTIHLKDDARKRVVRFNLRLVTQTDTTRVEIRRRRRQLVRMAYFLGSKRQADGAVGSAGKQRFERDLLERFQNVVRSGSIDELTLENYRIESRGLDAGVEPE